MNNFYALLIGLIMLTMALLVANEIINEHAPSAPPPEAQNHDPGIGSAPVVAPPVQPPVHAMAPVVTSPSPLPAVVVPHAATHPSTTVTEPLVLPTVTADLATGKKIYVTSCYACHETGAGGAPRRGDQAAWQPRLAQGMGQLIAHVLNGFNAMPPRGGDPSLTENDVATVIPYLISGAGDTPVR